MLHEPGCARVADVDHVAVLQDEAARADRHHLQLVAALLAQLEYAEHAHVLRVAVAVEVLEAALVGMRVLVGESKTGHRNRERGEADTQDILSRKHHRSLSLFMLAWRYLYSPGCSASHFWMIAATSRLFLSMISMWPLPRMPICGRSAMRTLPPAARIVSK